MFRSFLNKKIVFEFQIQQISKKYFNYQSFIPCVFKKIGEYEQTQI